MHKTAIIEVDCTYHGILIVGNKGFLMNKAGLVLINLHTRTHKIGVCALCHYLDFLLIGDARSDNTHVNTAGCGITQCLRKVVINNQIWRGDKYVITRLIDQIEKGILARGAILNRRRARAEGDIISTVVIRRCRYRAEKSLVVADGLCSKIPIR